MTHSPGPFSVGASRACEIEILDSKGCEVARVDIPITADRSTDPCDVQAANVALLTSAPDLLRACIAAVSLLDGEAEHCEREGKRNAAMNVREVDRMLKAAIARARGGVA